MHSSIKSIVVQSGQDTWLSPRRPGFKSRQWNFLFGAQYTSFQICSHNVFVHLHFYSSLLFFSCAEYAEYSSQCSSTFLLKFTLFCRTHWIISMYSCCNQCSGDQPLQFNLPIGKIGTPGRFRSTFLVRKTRPNSQKMHETGHKLH